MISSMIFFPEKEFYEKPADYGFVFEHVYLETSDSVKLHGWYLHALGTDSSREGMKDEEGVILFFHGNAGNISHRLFKVKGWVERKFSVLLLDYRGYGQSQGKIENEEDIVRDAEAAYQWITEKKKVAPGKLVFYGESLGSFAAIRLGAKYPVKGIILEAPFTSFTELSGIHYPFLPGAMRQALLKNFQFQNGESISKICSPLFILHGTRDEICPYGMSEKLFEKAPQPKSHFTIEGGAHNDLPVTGGADFWNQPFHFLTNLKPQK